MRRSLNSDEFASLASPRARLEVPLDAVDAYIFTIDGVLQGSKLIGCLLAGECMLIRAKNEREAQDLANAGLRDTLKLLHEEFAQRSDSRLVVVEGGGRRYREGGGEPLPKLPELRAMLWKAFEPKR